MWIQRLWWLAAGLGLLAGCASTEKTPKYVTNFDQIQSGMTRSQVRQLLGCPSLVATHSDVQAHVVVPDANDPWSAFKQSVSNVFSDGELWQYGQYNLSDWEEPPELLDGSPKSFMVFFDARGNVVRCRKPLQGPYASEIRPYSTRPPASRSPSPSLSPSPSPSELWSGDPFGRDKANLGPTTQP